VLPQYSSRQNCNMKPVPQWRATKFRWKCRKFSQHADLAPAVCAPLLTALCLALLQSLIRLIPVTFFSADKANRAVKLTIHLRIILPGFTS